MKNTKAHLLVLVTLALAGFQAQAESLVDGSAEDGKNKSLTCSACHGTEGNSMSPLWPNIAGQNAIYLANQLKAFRGDPGASDRASTQTRKDPLMTSMSLPLSDQDINDLAVYFEGLPGAAQSVADPDDVARGQALYRGGNTAEGIAACIACHGPTGRGNPAAGYPALAGQHSAYTAKQLQDYAAGTRMSGEPVHMMQDIAERLSKEDIQALASYVQGLK
jgi:cytochrome c553